MFHCMYVFIGRVQCYCWSGKDWTGRNKSYIDSPTDFLDGNTIWFSMSDLCNCRWFCGLLKAVIIHAYLHRGVANYEGTTNASNFLSWSISGYIGQNYEDDFYCSELWKPLVEAEGKERIKQNWKGLCVVVQIPRIHRCWNTCHVIQGLGCRCRPCYKPTYYMQRKLEFRCHYFRFG